MDEHTTLLRELTIRYAVKPDQAGRPIPLGQALTTPRVAADLLLRLLADEASEVFALALLSPKHRVLAYHEVSRGTLDSTLVHPREVFKAAMLANAAALVLAHVHPSGDPTPCPATPSAATRHRPRSPSCRTSCRPLTPVRPARITARWRGSGRWPSALCRAQRCVRSLTRDSRTLRPSSNGTAATALKPRRNSVSRCRR